MRLIPLLDETQHRLGHLDADALRGVAAEARVPLHLVQQVVSFYPHFRTTPPPRVEVAVCRDVSCWMRGAADCSSRLYGLTGDIEVRDVSCIGRCDAAPAALVNGIPVRADDPRLADFVRDPATLPSARPDAVRSWEVDPYASPTERYATLKRVRAGELDAVAILKEAGLRGMGGAGFPTGLKWELVRKETRTTKYVVCNADESEPGTFKDREILADLPHLVIEGMAIAGHVVGAARGILYLRHEYAPEQVRFEAELRRARQSGVLGDFELEVFVSPGGYILGEETALLEALEDKRGEPRNKPPFPGTHGLHGQPTLINNVETLAVATTILTRGADWWKSRGRPGFAGLKFIAVSGHVEKPGVYLIQTGTPVRELIETAGGVSGGRKLLAFLPGGASSNVLPADKADVPLDFAAVQKAGSMLGSGASWSWPRGPTCWRWRRTSCGSSATSRAASACRAEWDRRKR